MTHAQLAERTRGPVPGAPSSALMESPSGGFRDFEEYLLAVREAALLPFTSLPRQTDSRLVLLNRRGALGSNEAVPAEGGFAVPPQFTQEIVRRMTDVGQIFRRCYRVGTTSNSYSFPQYAESSRTSRFGGVEVYTEQEAEAMTPSKPALMRSELTMRKVIGLQYLTSELAADSDAFNTWSSFAFGQELAFKIEDLVVNGTGGPQPTGILNAPCLITISKEQAQASSSVVSANILGMLNRLWSPSRRTSVWLYNPEHLGTLSTLTTAVGAGGSVSGLWRWANGTDEYDRLGGLVALPCEFCAAPGSVGDLVLFDPQRVMIVIRELVRGEVSIHCRFLTDEVAYRFILRSNSQPVDPTPITPLHGSLTRSSCITLAERT